MRSEIFIIALNSANESVQLSEKYKDFKIPKKWSQPISTKNRKYRCVNV